MKHEQSKKLLQDAVVRAEREIESINKAIEQKCKALYKQRKVLEDEVKAYKLEKSDLDKEDK